MFEIFAAYPGGSGNSHGILLATKLHRCDPWVKVSGILAASISSTGDLTCKQVVKTCDLNSAGTRSDSQFLPFFFLEEDRRGVNSSVESSHGRFARCSALSEAIHWVVLSCNVEIFKKMMENGADPGRNLADRGLTPRLLWIGPPAGSHGNR